MILLLAGVWIFALAEIGIKVSSLVKLPTIGTVSELWDRTDAIMNMKPQRPSYDRIDVYVLNSVQGSLTRVFGLLLATMTLAASIPLMKLVDRLGNELDV